MNTFEPYRWVVLHGAKIKLRVPRTYTKPKSFHNPLGYEPDMLESLISGKPVPLDDAPAGIQHLEKAGYASIIVAENKLCYAATQAALLELQRVKDLTPP